MKTVPSYVSQQLKLLSSGAEPSDVRSGKSFIAPGSQAIQEGTMVDNGDLGTIIPGTEPIEIPVGYTEGGTVAGDENLIPENIKTGVTIFEVEGTAILAEGNATSADVREGVTFSSSAGYGVGSMPDNGDLGTIVPGTSDQSIPEGYTSGGIVAGDPNLVASNIKSGVEIFGVTGSAIQATGTATADKLLAGETASNENGPIIGTMPNNGSLGTITPTTSNQTIPAGYTSGGTVAGSVSLLPGNIRLGVNIFGVTGTLDPGTQTGGTAQSENVLEGKTFTNDLGEQIGTMPNNGSVTITPSNTDQAIPEGYHDGTGIVEAVTFDPTKVLEGTTIAGIAGTMQDNGSLGTITPSTSDQSIPSGYTSGGTVLGDNDLIPENIKDGVTIFGVEGTLSGTEINGQMEETLEFADDIDAYDPIYVTSEIDGTASIDANPTSTSYGGSFTQESEYFVSGQSVYPYLNIYKRSGDNFNRLDNPSNLPTGQVGSISFSPDETYLAVAHINSPFVTIYKRSGDTFTKLENPASLPTGNGRSVRWSSDGTYLFIAHDTSPYVTIYKRSGDTFTKLANPAVLPTGDGRGVAISSDDSLLAISHATSPYITIYSRSGDTFTKISNPTELPPGDGSLGGISFSHNNNYLVVGSESPPYLIIYKNSEGTLTKMSNPPISPSGTVLGISFSNNDGFMALAHVGSPYFSLYRRYGDSFSKLPNPSPMPSGTGRGISYSPDDKYLSLTFNSSPFLYIYELSEKCYKSVGNNWFDSVKVGYAKESGTTGEKKTVVITHH